MALSGGGPPHALLRRVRVTDERDVVATRTGARSTDVNDPLVGILEPYAHQADRPSAGVEAERVTGRIQENTPILLRLMVG